MSKKFVVRWTPEAEDDAAGIADYFDDTLNAEKVLAQFDLLAASLHALPERGRVVPELRKIGIYRYREVIHKPWRIVYIIQNIDIWIMGAFDGRRNLTDLLFERLAR